MEVRHVMNSPRNAIWSLIIIPHFSVTKVAVALITYSDR